MSLVLHDVHSPSLIFNQSQFKFIWCMRKGMDVAFSCMINFLLKVLAFLYTYNYTGTHFRQYTVFYNKSSIKVSQDTIQTEINV